MLLVLPMAPLLIILLCEELSVIQQCSASIMQYSLSIDGAL